MERQRIYQYRPREPQRTGMRLLMGAAGAAVGIATYSGLQVTGVCEGYQLGPSDGGYMRTGTQCGDYTGLKVQIEQTGRIPPRNQEDTDPNGEELGIRFVAGNDSGDPWRVNGSVERTHIRGKEEMVASIYILRSGHTIQGQGWVPIESDLVLPGGE